MRTRVPVILASLLLALAAVATLGGLWLFLDAGRDREHWFAERKGELDIVAAESLASAAGLAAAEVRLQSDSGLAIALQVLRPAAATEALPVLVLLGGHRTGRDAVSLFDELDGLAVVALDYPYDGPPRTRGLTATVAALPAVRRAFLDIVPAVSLVIDWLQTESWADGSNIMLAGVSLGVPFAATAAARDERVARLMLVHGAADNRRWIELNLARRVDAGPLQPLLATLLNWAVYGPLHDTAAHVARMSPRPVLIIGARDDERVPPGETEALYAAAREPKSLRWTGGRHVQPGRREVVDELLALLAAETAP